MNTNNVISPFTLVFPKVLGRRIQSDKRKPVLALTQEDLKACLLLAGQESAGPRSRAILASSTEAYLRRLLAHCAVRIHIPAFAHSKWLSPRSVKRFLAPSVQKHIIFVDRRGKLWDATCEFLAPILSAGSDDGCVSQVFLADSDDGCLSQIAWDMYVLVLAVRYKAEAVVSPDRFIANAARLDKSCSISAEGRARLARLVGLVRLFDIKRVAPSLRLLSDVGPQEVSRRIAEILEDAYLLEASHLRRMFGLKQNVTAIKRDLRKLLDFIVKTRSWARGLVSLSPVPLVGGDSGTKVMDALLGMLPVLQGSVSQPVIACTDMNVDFSTEGCVRVVRMLSGDWGYLFE